MHWRKFFLITTDNRLFVIHTLLAYLFYRAGQLKAHLNKKHMNVKDDVVITRTGPHQTMEFQFKSGGDAEGKLSRKILVYSFHKLNRQISNFGLFAYSKGYFCKHVVANSFFCSLVR